MDRRWRLVILCMLTVAIVIFVAGEAALQLGIASSDGYLAHYVAWTSVEIAIVAGVVRLGWVALDMYHTASQDAQRNGRSSFRETGHVLSRIFLYLFLPAIIITAIVIAVALVHYHGHIPS
jgi:hypothetical protein